MNAEVVQRVKLTDISIRRVNAEVADEFTPRLNVPPVCRVIQGPEKELKMTVFTPNEQVEGMPPGVIQYLIGFSASLHASENPTSEVVESQDEPVVATIDAQISVLYSVLPGHDVPDEKDLLKFGEVAVIFQAWPYWRELVQSMCDRLAVPRAIIPLIRVNPGSGSLDVVSGVKLNEEVAATIKSRARRKSQ